MKKIIVSTLLSSLLLTNTIFAKSDTEPTSKEVSKNAIEIATKKAENNQVKLIQEALNSLEITAKALKNLEDNKKDEAKKNIELALGKLEVILTSKDVPKLLPIKNRLIVKNFIGDAKDVESALKKVKILIDNGKIQEARELLISLQSELDIVTVNLPLSTYPDTLKLASKYLIEGKIEEAKDTLKLALNTFVNIQTIIPIPLINTVKLVAVASNKAKENKDLAIKYLSSADDELNKAEKLGYISKSITTYKKLHTLIKNVEKEIKGENKAEKLFNELKKRVTKTSTK